MTKRDLIDQYKDYPDRLTIKQVMEICDISKRRAIRLTYEEPLRFERVAAPHGGRKMLMVYKTDVLYLLYKRLSLLQPDELYKDVAKEYYNRYFENDPDVLTTPQVVELIGYRKQTIQRWLLSGELPSFRRYERYRVLKTDLIKFVISGRYRAIVKKSIIHQYCENEIISRMELRAKR